MAFRVAAALLALASMFSASPALWAKGRMIRIEISGGTLTSPLQITDPQRLEEFTFFDAPGNNSVTLENAERGSIIDWKTGIVRQHAADLQRYEISFYWMGCARDDPTPRDGKHELNFTARPSPNSSARSPSTRTSTDSATCAALRAS